MPETIGMALLAVAGISNTTLFVVGTTTVTLASVVGFVAMTGPTVGTAVELRDEDDSARSRS